MNIHAHRARARSSALSSGWQSMSSAPRDGSIIELRCDYGIAPWFGLFRWDGERWSNAIRDGSSVSGEDTLTWRHTTAFTSNYVDPTGGQQDDPHYWRVAAARSYGLSDDYFEERACEKSAVASDDTRFWWQFWK